MGERACRRVGMQAGRGDKGAYRDSATLKIKCVTSSGLTLRPPLTAIIITAGSNNFILKFALFTNKN